MTFAAVVLIFAVLFNISMWIVFFRKFNAFFSTDKIIEETNEKAKEIIKNINFNAGRNIDLIEDRIKQLKAVTAEAERRIIILKKELDVTDKSRKFQQKMEFSTKKNIPVQGDLFFAEQPAGDEHAKKETEPEKSSVRQTSFSEPEIFISDNPVVLKKDFKSQVKEFHSLGLPAEEIARRTGRSIQEVRLVIEFT